MLRPILTEALVEPAIPANREPATRDSYPLPIYGIFVAITVMNWTLASSGRVAM